MEEWHTYFLKDIATFSQGIQVDIDNQFIKKDNGLIRFIRIIDYSKNNEPPRYISCPKNSYIVNDDDIVMIRYGSQTAGKVVRGISGAIANNMFKITLNNNIITNEYAYYYLSQTSVFNNLRGSQSSSTMPAITFELVGRQKILLPNIRIQEKITTILSSLDDKIELNRRINENLEQQAQALFKSWFVDFEPFKDGKFVDSELGMIPEGWKVNNIYEYIDVIYGAPYKSSLFNTDKNGYPLIRIRDLKTYTPQFYTPEILPNTEYIYPGDVIAGMDAEFIPTLWLGEKGLLNQRCCKFISKRKNISNYYLLYLLMPELLCVQNYKTGTTVSHLGKADIDRFKVITPPIEIIEKFSTLVNPLYNEKIKLACENRIITNLRDALLPKLMSGELKLSEIETKLDE